MSKNIYPWVKPLGLSSSNFSDKPEGADALVWGLKNNRINPEEYLAWASDYYHLPAIKPEFFSMAVDFTLVEKYANLYDWYAYCYPIYNWEGTLFVACLEPPKAPINAKVCFVIAPFHALESAWQKHENSRPGIQMATEQMPIVTDEPIPSMKSASEFTATEVLKDHPVAPGAPSELGPDLGLKDIDPTREQKVATAPPQPQPEKVEAQADPIPQPPPVEQQQPVVPEPAPVQQTPSVETAAPVSKEPAKEQDPPQPTPEAKKEETPKTVPETTGLDFGDLKKEMGVDENFVADSSKGVPPEPSQDVGVLDFSSMEETAFGEEVDSASEADNKDQQAEEMTHTKLDNDLNNLTSATQTMHVHNHTMTATTNNTETPSLPFEEVTIKGMSLEGEKTEVDQKPQEEKTKLSPAAEKEKKQTAQPATPPPANPNVIIPPPPQPAQPQQQQQQQQQPVPPPVQAPETAPAFQDENSIPSLDDLKQHQTENPAKAPGLEESDINLEAENRQLGKEDDLINDDYTPVPILTKAQKEAQERRKKEAQLKEQESEKSRLTENTITDHAQPILIPADNLISDTDLQMAANLDNATNLKHVIAHIFGHLKRDYNKLMWVEKRSDGQYFVKYVMGDWKITELAWKMHINTSNPNIFRVAFKSGHPYHGEINTNPYNDKYFEWWTRGKTPDFCTIFPVTHHEDILGFIAGFEKAEEFDEVGSLKKVENLITICKKALQKFAAPKAA